MRITFKIMGLLIMMVSLASSAAANCRVIDTLDKIHTTQTRLAHHPETPLRLSELRYLRRHAALLSNTVVLNAVGTSALSAQGASFLRFTRHLDELLNQVSIDDPVALRQHYANPNVKTNLNSIGRRIATLRCSAAEIAASEEIPDFKASDVTNFHRDAIIDFFSIKVLLILTGTISVMLIFAYLYRPNRPNDKRRLERFFAHYAVTYRVENHILSGTILNINKNGAKLKHGRPERLVPGSSLSILVMDDTWIPGVVRWSNDIHSGIAFKTPLNSKQEQRIRGIDIKTKQAA